MLIVRTLETVETVEYDTTKYRTVKKKWWNVKKKKKKKKKIK